MVSLEAFSAEVLTFVGNCANTVVGIRLSPPQGLHRRHRLRYADGFEEPLRDGDGGGGVGTVNVALKSSLAHAMLRMAEPEWRDDAVTAALDARCARRGSGGALRGGVGIGGRVCGRARARGSAPELLLDCCCGNGIIPLEAAVLYAGAMQRGDLAVVGSDVDAASLEIAVAARALSAAARGGKGVVVEPEFLRADCRFLPFATASVTRVVSDLPFGQRCDAGVHATRLMPALLRELVRVLAPGGVAVLLTLPIKVIARTIAQSRFTKRLVVECVLVVDMGGYMCRLVRLRRTAVGVLPPKFVPQSAARCGNKTPIRCYGGHTP